jgi:heme-degrading monooxygenase HmoA
MYMRFVHLQVKQGHMADLRQFYEDRVLTTLQETEGCLFASLLQPTTESDELLSMTLWSSYQHADEYEESGRFDELLDESDPFLTEATEWKVRLAGDHGGPVSTLQDPEVEVYPVEVGAQREGTELAGSAKMYLNIAAVRVEPGQFAALAERYNEEAVPELLTAPGCRAVFLVEGMQGRARALSVTVWDSEEAAMRWQRSGKLKELMARHSEFFSGLYHWKMSLRDTDDDDGVRLRDFDFSSYRVITGRRLRE